LELNSNKLLPPAFCFAAALGAWVFFAGVPFEQFLPLTLAGSDLALQNALADMPPGAARALLPDFLFALCYALVLSLAARDLAPLSASPAAGMLLSKAIWLGAAADIAENSMLLMLFSHSASVDAALLRGAAVLKFAIFIAACGWVGGAAWRARRRLWSALALAAAALTFLSVMPVLLG
jgi:hypothetical protein